MMDSKSTDKLSLLTGALEKIPKEVLLNVKSCVLSWKTITDDDNHLVIALPEIKIEFK